jgi:hypothetical protein
MRRILCRTLILLICSQAISTYAQPPQPGVKKSITPHAEFYILRENTAMHRQFERQVRLVGQLEGLPETALPRAIEARGGRTPRIN